MRMKFLLKVRLQDFYSIKDTRMEGMVKFVRKMSKCEDIYPEDIKMMRVNKKEKFVIFVIERERKKNIIEVYNNEDLKKLAKA